MKAGANYQGDDMSRASTVDKYLICHAALRMLGAAISQIRDEELMRFGITNMQAGILFAISALGRKATPTVIARGTFRKPHTISESLSRLEAMGLVERRNDLSKASQVRIVLTEKGKRISKLANSRQSIRRIFSGLNEDELRQMTVLANRLVDRVNQEYGVDASALHDKVNFYQQWLNKVDEG
jgi:DNA-binding MarR family transcriptional regulator